MEQLIQIGADFIEAQGMMAFVVVILAVLMYRDQTARAAESKRQSDNFAVESKQQGEMLKILRQEVANNAAMITRVDQVETNLINKAQSISDAATLPLIASIEEVKTTGNEIMATVTPIDQMLKEIRDEIKQLRASVDQFHSGIITKTEGIETRLNIVEKRATQETPQVQSAPTKTQAKKTPNIIPLVKPEEKTE